jgi:hypothetical protein
MSIYIAHVAVIVIPMRIAGHVLASSEDAFIAPPGTIWRYADWIADLFLIPAGVVLFVLFYGLFYAWDRWGGSGVGTCEWLMSQAANRSWQLVENLPWLTENVDQTRSRLPSFFVRL